MKVVSRSARCIATFVYVVVALSCADQNRIAGPPPLRMKGEPAGQPQEAFFKAWSNTVQSSPIPTMVGGLIPSQYRQYVGFVADPATLTFASQYPGRLYINGDEPDTYPNCIPAAKYDTIYHDFVIAIRSVDATARFSPAGFSENNANYNPCPGLSHSTAYAQQFYDAYPAAWGAPPVSEWRFHDFGLDLWADTTAWKARVASAATWSVNHGANMVLGSFGFTNENWKSPSPVALSTFLYMERQMLLWLQRQANINQAVWWAYEAQLGYTFHPLVDANGVQTPEGQVYQWYPPAEIPTGATAVGAGSYGAKLQWTNTSNTWPIKVEFWVKPAGSSTFSLNRTVYPGVGGTDTGVWGFPYGSQVKGRVIYYNGTTIGEWSAWSNTVLVQ